MLKKDIGLKKISKKLRRLEVACEEIEWETIFFKSQLILSGGNIFDDDDDENVKYSFIYGESLLGT